MAGVSAEKHAKAHIGIQLVAGSSAGAISKTAVAPLERVRIILQVAPVEERYQGIARTLYRIAKEQGFRAYWRGNGANVARIIPNAALKFSCFDRFKEWTLPLGERAYRRDELFARKMLSGGMAGAVTLTLTYPLEMARTRLTADTTMSGQRLQYGGIYDCLRATVKHEGAAGIYKGFGISLCSMCLYLSISFPLYDTLKDYVDQPSPLTKLLMGSTAGVAAQSVTYPMDTVRRRMQLNGALGAVTRYSSVTDCVARIFATEGVGAFYRGLLANAVKATPGAAIQFVAYDSIKEALRSELVAQ